MENIDKKQCGDMCKESDHSACCGGIGHMQGCHGGKCHLVKMILKIIIVILVFFFGFKIGVMTGYLQAGYGRGVIGENNFGMMRGFNYYNNPLNNGGTQVPAQ